MLLDLRSAFESAGLHDAIVGTGGVLVSGVAPVAAHQAVVAVGGVGVSGAADFEAYSTFEAAGGSVVSGAATVAVHSGVIATGGVSVSGAADQTEHGQNEIVGAGGVIVSGAADVTSHQPHAELVAAGGVVVGGAATFSETARPRKPTPGPRQARVRAKPKPLQWRLDEFVVESAACLIAAVAQVRHTTFVGVSATALVTAARGWHAPIPAPVVTPPPSRRFAPMAALGGRGGLVAAVHVRRQSGQVTPAVGSMVPLVRGRRQTTLTWTADHRLIGRSSRHARTRTLLLSGQSQVSGRVRTHREPTPPFINPDLDVEARANHARWTRAVKARQELEVILMLDD